VIFEIILLGLASSVRPTSLAAVSTLLTRESRRRLMFAYVIGGLAFTLMFGFVVVGVFHGIHFHAGTDRTKAIADIVAGVVAVLFGCAVLAGAFRRHPDRPPRDHGTTWMARLDHQVTVRVAAIAGPLTHIPGIFYLVALNLIVAHNPELPGGIFAVATYNGVWFALPIAALVVCIVDPDAAQRIVAAVADWTKRHSRSIVLVTSFVVGVALIARGALAV
jgi:cytochrome bd-type quinol oxidase subunit 2